MTEDGTLLPAPASLMAEITSAQKSKKIYIITLPAVLCFSETALAVTTETALDERLFRLN